MALSSAEKSKRYRERHPERMKASNLKYRLNNKHKIYLIQKRWSEKNKEKIRQYSKDYSTAYYQKNKDRIKERSNRAYKEGKFDKQSRRKYAVQYRKSGKSIKKWHERINKYPWLKTLHYIRGRCNDKKRKYYGAKGIRCILTQNDIKHLWFRYKVEQMKKPTIHRINSNDHYRIDNCIFVEWEENQK